MRFQQCLMVAALMPLIAAGCRKDKDSQPPSVRITAPGAEFSVNIPDTFTVGVAVSDDHIVKGLSILIADIDGVPITGGIAVSVNTASKQVELDFPLRDERITSGQYILTAVADDGVNTARDFLTITVQAAPLRVRSTYLIPPVTQSPPFTVTCIDSAGALSTFAVLNELGGAAIDRDNLYTAGTASEPLRRWRLGSASSTTLSINGALSPMFFKGLHRDPVDGRIYMCTADGAVRGFDSNGGQTFSGQAPSGFLGETTALVGGFLFCSAVNPVNQQRLLVKHGYGSGVRLAEFNSTAAPVALFERDAQHVLIFGNAPSGAVILDVSTEQGGAFEMRVFPGEPLLAVESFSPGRFVLGFGSGIRRFEYQSNTVTEILPGVAADGLTFDPVSGAVIAASGNQIVAFNPVLGTVVSAQSAPHPVGQVLLRLNR